MTTIEVTVLADEDQDFVMSILNALAQKHIIELDSMESLPAEGPTLTMDQLKNRIAESGRSKQYSFEEAKAKLGL